MDRLGPLFVMERGTVPMGAELLGGAVGPRVTGVLHDATGGHTEAFWLGIAVAALSAVSIWQASRARCEWSLDGCTD